MNYSLLKILTRYESLVEECELDEDYYIIYEDKFGRKWKLKPVTNENIKQPFIIKPIFDGEKPLYALQRPSEETR